MKLYHATAAPNVPSILKEGLIPRKGKGGDNWAVEHDALWSEVTTKEVYLAGSLTAAKAFAQFPATENKSKAAVLRVTVPKDKEASLEPDEQWEDGHAYKFKGKIPASWISVAVPEITVEQSVKINNRYKLITNVDSFARADQLYRGLAFLFK